MSRSFLTRSSPVLPTCIEDLEKKHIDIGLRSRGHTKENSNTVHGHRHQVIQL